MESNPWKSISPKQEDINPPVGVVRKAFSGLKDFSLEKIDFILDKVNFFPEEVTFTNPSVTLLWNLLWCRK